MSSFEISPIAIPATCSLIGTPAAINDKLDAHTDACEVDPLDEIASLTTLIVYGKSTFGGTTGTKAFSANAPCPISLLFGPLIGYASPVEYGGKL